MAFPTPAQIQKEYFDTLKALKPSLNVNDPNSDFVIRGKALAGIISGVFGDQQKVNNDTWVGSARPEAVILKGIDLGILRQPATTATSPSVRITGANGVSVAPGDLTFLYLPTNVLYTNTTGGTIAAGILSVSIKAVVSGQRANVIAPDNLKVVSPPNGVNADANILTSIADGSDIETIDSLKARILSREQDPPAGGNVTDYPNFAFLADPSVRSARVRRFGRGLGTVDVFITTGTTDIDSAVTAGTSVVRIPSPSVLATVQAYYNTHVPLTDCPAVYAPEEVTIPVSVKVRLAQGLTLSSVPADSVNNPQGLTVQQLIAREVSRALYKLPVGGRLIPGLTDGYVVAADIEADLDLWLSGVKDPVTGAYLGRIPVLADRQVQPLDGSNVNRAITQNQLASPGTITVTIGV